MGRRVLMISFWYPPLGGSGPLRNAHVARMLRARGWEPVVLTAQRWAAVARDPTVVHVPAARRVPAFDPAVLLALPRKLGLGRMAAWVERWAFFPDRMALWAAAALPAALSLARSCEAIVSSSPPESAHLLGWVVARMTGRPWVADFRSEWTEDPRGPPAGFRIPERLALKWAARLVTLSPEHAQRLGAKAVALPVGIDPAEMRPAGLPPPRRRARIAYAGVISGARVIGPFLDAAEEAVRRGWMPPDALELWIYGAVWGDAHRLARTTIAVRSGGRLSRAAVLEALRETDFLLATLEDRAGRWLLNKVFDYAAVGRPILAFVPPEGSTGRWVRATGTGFVLPPDRPQQAAHELACLWSQWQEGSLRWSRREDRLAEEFLPQLAERWERLLGEVAPIRRARRRAVAMGLIFTRGLGLRAWRDHGILRRELALFERLVRLGFRVHLFTYDPPGPPPEPLSDGIEFCPMPVAMRDRWYALLLPLLQAQSLARLRVVRTQQHAGAHAAVLAKWLFGLRLVVRSGYVMSIFEQERGRPWSAVRAAKWTERLAYTFASASAITTREQARYIRRRYRPRRGIEVVPNYVDTDLFRPLALPKMPRSLCFVGRLHPQKNLESLLAALQGLEASLTIVGDGPLRERLKERAAALGVPVRFEGVVPNEQLPEILCQHELFVLASLYEGFPKVVVEAMACGLPVVVTDFSGVREVVAPAEVGLICKTDPASLRAAVKRLLDDADLRARMGAAARRWVEERFSLDTVARMEARLLWPGAS